MRIDLHTHSTASDGTDSPAALVAAAAAAGLDVLGLTDHDTVAGWAAAADALPAGMTLVGGLELSCRWWPPPGGPDGGGTALHLLGYLVDPAAPDLATALAGLRESRRGRARRMVELMAADGLPVSWEQVRAFADGGAVGRPHIGRALVAAGVVSSLDQAFAEYLNSRSPYHLSKEDLDALAGIRLIRAAGGVPVFAHPYARRRGRVVGPEAIAAMAAAGLGGLEVDHPDQDEPDRAALRSLAADLGLLVTGSSDYHGTNKTVRLAAGTTDPAVYEALVAAATGTTPVRA